MPAATFPQPPSLYSVNRASTMGTGASGEILSTLPYVKSSSIRSPKTAIFDLPRRRAKFNRSVILFHTHGTFKYRQPPQGSCFAPKITAKRHGWKRKLIASNEV